jgi:hypothetical protein
MKLAIAFTVLCLGTCYSAFAQTASKAACCVRIVKDIKFKVKGEATAPMKQDSVDAVFRPGFSIGISYGFTENIRIDAEFSHGKFSPHFDPLEYAEPFIDRGFATIDDNGTRFRKNNVLLGLTYNYYLNPRVAVGVSFRSGLSFNKYPDFVITQNYNGSTTEIAKYSAPANISATYFIFQPGLSLDYFITDRINVFMSGKYLHQPNSEEFSYRYKDLSRVDYNRTAKEIQDQIDQASMVTAYTSGVRRAVSVGAGISLSFGGRTKMLSAKPQGDVVIPLSQ